MTDAFASALTRLWRPCGQPYSGPDGGHDRTGSGAVPENGASPADDDRQHDGRVHRRVRRRHRGGGKISTTVPPCCIRSGPRISRWSRRRCVHESKTAGRLKDRAPISPAPAATGSQSPSSCRCGRSSAKSAPPVGNGIMAAFQAHARSATRPPPRHRYRPRRAGRSRSRSRSARCTEPRFMQLRNDHHRHKSSRRAKPPRAICLAPRKQKLVGIPCRRAVAEANQGPDRLSSTMRTF
jgi:hypothetical protein